MQTENLIKILAHLELANWDFEPGAGLFVNNHLTLYLG